VTRRACAAHRTGLAAAALLALACATRAPELDELVAIEAIQQLKARYMRCIDTRDLECLRTQVFAADAELYFRGGDYEFRARGWDEIQTFYEGAFTPTRFGMHHVHHPEIAVTGDTATGTWYLEDIFINLEDDTTLRGSALYHDRYAKRDGEWRIVYSTYDRLWEEIEPRSPDIRLNSQPIR
jgi:hypothetical protein